MPLAQGSAQGDSGTGKASAGRPWLVQAQQWLKARAAVMVGVSSYRDGGSGSKQGRQRRALRRLGMEEDEVNEKALPSFIL